MLGDYLKLVKFRYHISFFIVLFGALYFAQKIDFYLLSLILLVYISFNILMYSGLYTLNDMADRRSDSLHPKKKNRPVASGRISLFNAGLFSFLAILGGLAISFFAFRNLFYIYLIFIGVNLLYSFILKKIPYIELLGNSVTYPLRLILGASLVGAVVPLNISVACFFVALGAVTKRRIVEMNYKGYGARKVLLHYSKVKLDWIIILSFVVFIPLFLVNFLDYRLIYSLSVIFYLIFVLTDFSKTKKLAKEIWVN